jgi:hypothetical protein
LNSKKNLEEEVLNNPEYELFFFDESRFGTHSRLGHGWFKTGTRPTVKKKLGFQNFYLYGAVSPKSGRDFALIAPNVNTTCMNVFLEQMSQWLGCKKALIVLDQAGWHQSKDLLIPDNIRLIYLPPYTKFHF